MERSTPRARAGVSPARGVRLARVLLPVSIAAACAVSACARLEIDVPSPPPPPPAPPAGDHATVGLTSLVAGVDRLRAEWRVHSGAPLEVELALFVATARADVFDATPLLLTGTEAHVLVQSLATDQDYYVGLGQRASPSDAFTPAGPVLRARTGTVIYVDPAADGSGDGTSASSPLGDLTLGVLNAFVAGGANVWVRGGTFTTQSVPLFAGVHLSGGFSSTFRLVDRDTVLNPTRLEGFAGQPVVALQTGTAGPGILDGFELDGLNVASDGVFESSEHCELRSVRIRRCGRGVRLRAPLATTPVPVVLANVTVQESQNEGLSLDGAFDLALEGCVFDANANEGCDLNHLVAPEFSSANLRIRGSRFLRNGTEGLDAHLGVPAGAGHGGGRFRVEIEDCDFELNALDGARVDIDYDFFPEWDAEITVRGCRARANGGSGVHLDLDSRASAIVHRLWSSANRLDGLGLTSESYPGFCTVSASVLAGNLGRGAHASLGHYALSLSHCIVAGNATGGVHSSIVRSIVHSTIFDRQPDALVGTTAIACPSATLVDASPFELAPLEFLLATGASADLVTVTAAPSVRPAASFELDDDGVACLRTGGAGTTLALDPVPTAFSYPCPVGVFATTTVAEDWRLQPASIGVASGFAAPSSPPVDAGIFGTPLGGVPGREAAVPPPLFRLASTTPAWSDPVASNQTIEFGFEGGDLDPASISAAVFAFDARGAERVIAPFAGAGTVSVPAPTGGWHDGDVIAVFETLRSLDGDELGAPVAVTLRVP